MSQPEKQQASSLEEILQMIGAMAALDFSIKLPVRLKTDNPLDAISYGLNMLSEELKDNVIEKEKLKDINLRLEEFAYTASHDLKSPLHSIQGLVQLIRLEMEGPGNTHPQLLNLLEVLETLVYKMHGMIDGILEYSRLDGQMFPKENLDLGKIMMEELKLHEGERVQIKTVSHLPVIRYNRIAFFQIMDNLVTNAIKFCDKTICEINIWVTDGGPFYILSVSDNGPGIPSQNQQRIFELFMRLRENDGPSGSGIGLATVRKLVQQLGGQIWVTSDPGNGSTFSFTIPKEKQVQVE